MVPWWIILARTGLPGYLGVLIVVPVVQIYPLIRIIFMQWPVHTELDEQNERVRELQKRLTELETLCNVQCPACGKPLRQVQVDSMLNNPAYSEWARQGFCCLECFRATTPAALTPARPASPEASPR
jgi:hypothetical protein